jgi:hypothetical protein
MRLDYLPDQAHSTSSTAVPVRIVRRRRESMKLPVDTSTIAFLCAVEAEPVVDFETKRPRADENGEPLYQHVMADRQGAPSPPLWMGWSAMPRTAIGPLGGHVEGTTLHGRGTGSGSQACDLRFGVERAKGIEPSPRAWEARVLPLNYARRRGDSSRAV